jgi:hypothetical protein
MRRVPPRLVLVEGSIGTGKTTTARRLAEALATRGVRARAVVEGDVAHPADLEQVALVPPDVLAGHLVAAPEWSDRVRRAARRDRAGLLVPYGVLERDHGPLPPALREAFGQRDAYELPLPVHLRLRREQWAGFVRDTEAGDDVVVLECCVVQNPLTVTLLRDDAPEEALRDVVVDLLATAAPLEPVLVHLRHADVGAAFRRAVAERPGWWRDHVVGYYTGRGFGRRLGVEGVDGVVEVLRHRALVEERLLDSLGTGPGAVNVLPVELRDGDAGLRDGDGGLRDGDGGLPEALRQLADGLAAGCNGCARSGKDRHDCAERGIHTSEG